MFLTICHLATTCARFIKVNSFIIKMLDLSKIDLSEYDIKRKLRLPKKLSNDLAYLCGVLAGDGHISKDYGNKCRNTIYCSGNPKDEIEYYDQIIVPLFFKLFNIKIKAKYFTDGTYGIRFDSKAIVQFLTKILNFSRGKKYNKLNIPQRFKKNKYLKLAFVRGLFDTDFGFCLCKKYKKDPYYPQLCFVSKSERFAKEIWKALKEVGIKFD